MLSADSQPREWAAGAHAQERTMATLNIDTADTGQIAKSDIRALAQQIQTGFADITQQVTKGFSRFEVARGKSDQRLASILLGGIAIATTIIVAVLA